MVSFSLKIFLLHSSYGDRVIEYPWDEFQWDDLYSLRLPCKSYLSINILILWQSYNQDDYKMTNRQVALLYRYTGWRNLQSICEGVNEREIS